MLEIIHIHANSRKCFSYPRNYPAMELGVRVLGSQYNIIFLVQILSSLTRWWSSYMVERAGVKVPLVIKKLPLLLTSKLFHSHSTHITLTLHSFYTHTALTLCSLLGWMSQLTLSFLSNDAYLDHNLASVITMPDTGQSRGPKPAGAGQRPLGVRGHCLLIVITVTMRIWTQASGVFPD